MANEAEEDRVGGGGAATSAGIIFQQEVGTIISTWMLTGHRVDPLLGLGNAKVEWIRFETEAPVDDIQFATTTGGYIAIQVKTKVSLSTDIGSQFGKTTAQFVRYWLACRDGTGDRLWNRPLDIAKDRLVMAVGKETPSSITSDLANALRLKAQPGSGLLTEAQARAYKAFSTCVQLAWESVTSEVFDTNLPIKLAPFIRVLVFDLSGKDRPGTEAVLKEAIEPTNAPSIVLGAIQNICGRLMSRRGGLDPSGLRQELWSQQITLTASADFREDISKLRRHTEEVMDSLRQYEEIQVEHGVPLSLERECQKFVLEAALNGSALIVGEPGSGKSGVMNALAKDFRSLDRDVLLLAVDRYSVETLEGLTNELELTHSLVKTLEAWDGTDDAWLLIDALDATRGGRGESVFRHLIEQVINLKGRWHVVASIRSFDLRMGQQYKTLFKGTPPDNLLQDPSFPAVRHIRVPSWSNTEFEVLLSKAPALAKALSGAPAALKDLASVPFNTRLLGDLVRDEVIEADLTNIGSQAELLQLYWDHRVVKHGNPARACIGRIATAMVEARSLRASMDEASGADPQIVDKLEGEGVIVSIERNRWVQFRHHLLFDFAVARILLNPDDLVRGKQAFNKADAKGLILAPALGFALRELWDDNHTRQRFWQATTHLLANEDCDPVVRSAVARLCAEYPTAGSDVEFLAQQVAAGNTDAAKAFSQLGGALSIRFEDVADVSLEPWVALLAGVARNIESATGTIRFLLYQMLQRPLSADQRRKLGVVARALLTYAHSLDEPGHLVTVGIDMVADTFDTDKLGSRSLLARSLHIDRLNKYAAEEVSTLARKLEEFAVYDPQFAKDIYATTFGFVHTDDRKTRLGNSQIISLTSTAQQDFDMAKYCLTEYLPDFLQNNPKDAVASVLAGIEGNILRDHPLKSDTLDEQLTIGGQTVRLREDWSHVWAYDPNKVYGYDGDALVKALVDHLKEVEEDAATEIAKQLIRDGVYAVVWARLFMVAALRRGRLLDLILPFAMTEPFLVLIDTRKDAIDAVAAGYHKLTSQQREHFELGALRFNFDQFSNPELSRQGFLERLFNVVRREELATDEARHYLQTTEIEKTLNNPRAFSIRTATGISSPYDWIKGLDRNNPVDRSLIEAIDETKARLQLDVPVETVATELSLEAALTQLNKLGQAIDRKNQNSKLVENAEGEIGRALQLLGRRQVYPKIKDKHSTGIFLSLLDLIGNSAGPEVDPETEQRFEESPSWGSPAARVEAAQLYLEFSLNRPDLYRRLTSKIDSLLADPHPAVRLQAVLHLVRIWDIDREAFWNRLSNRLACETNLSVLAHAITDVLGRVLYEEPERSASLVAQLLARFLNDSGRHERLQTQVAPLLAILWVRFRVAAANATLRAWLDKPQDHFKHLTQVIFTLRGAFIAGLVEPIDEHSGELRARALLFAAATVDVSAKYLLAHFRNADPSSIEIDQATEFAKLIDVVCRELFFAAGFRSSERNDPKITEKESLATFLADTAPMLERIGDCATPHTIYYLLQLLEGLVSVDPPKVFDLMAIALRNGGRRTGYQFESLGSDLLVRMVGVMLADHKEIFSVEARRLALIDCLEIFMEAGWPAARRLLYRLPELLQ